MPKLSKKSKDILATCHPQLIRLMNTVILTFDFSVICGFRNEVDQLKALQEGKTNLSWPNSKHNKQPSEAIDIAPYPIDWNDTKRFILMGGYILGIAEVMGISVRWGGDWNRNFRVNDETLQDYPHIELI